MLSILFKKNIYGREFFFLFFLYLTLILSFILGENSTGGAEIDFPINKQLIFDFSQNFIGTLLSYDEYSHRHSPVFLIFLSLFKKVGLSFEGIRIIHLHLSLLLPIIFFQCLKIKYLNYDKKILFFLTSLIFLSPTFRSLAIWPDSRLLGLILFSISIYHFLKFEDNKDLKHAIYNIIFLTLSAYISPNFSVFSIFFLIKFSLDYGIFTKKIFILVVLNLVLAIPALYYIFVLDIMFFLKSAAAGIDSSQSIIFNNLYNDIMITFSIIFFYLIPFIFFKVIKVENVLNFKNFLITLFILSICVFNFDYNYSFTGGGIFFKLSNYIFNNNYAFYIISLFAVMIVCPIINKNYTNVLLFVLIIINNPQYTIYHKYFDPFLLIVFFTIFSLNIDLNKIFRAKNYMFIFSYFLVFLILSNLKLIYV
tara:strand:- start:3738 stop:5003 length:1266 start_codon:yes stop_codon:yes gene_type:complete